MPAGPQQECVTLQAQYTLLREQHQENQHALHTLREQNKNLAHEKWIIAQEKAQLQGQLKQMQSIL